MIDNVIHIFYVFTELFCLTSLSMPGKSMLNSATVLVGLSLSPLNSVIICFMYFEALFSDTEVHISKHLTDQLDSLYYETSLFTLVTLFLEIYFK